MLAHMVDPKNDEPKTTGDLRERNARAILEAVRDNDQRGDPAGLTQATIRDRTKLAAGTVSTIISKMLIPAGVLKPSPDTTRRAGGPPPSLLSIDRKCGVILAVDCGIDCVRLGVAGADGVPLAAVEKRGTSGGDPWDILGVARDGLRDLLDRYADGNTARLVGYGISVPPAVRVTHTEAEVSAFTVHKGWERVHLMYELHDKLGWPVRPRVDSDSRLEALAEYRYGAGVKAKYLLFLKWSRNISAAVLIPPEGTVLAGSEGVASELGFARAPDQATTVSGKRETDSLNAIAGTDGKALRDLLHGEVTAEAVRKAHAEDRAPFERAAEQVGMTLGFAANIVNPDTIVLGGNFGRAAYDLVSRTVERKYLSQALPAAKRAQIRGSTLPTWPSGDNDQHHHAALRGAIAAVLLKDQPTYLMGLVRK